MGKGKRIREQKALVKKQQMEIMQAYERGKQEGFYDVIFFLREKLGSLTEVPGIGPSLERRIIKHFVKESLGDKENEFERLFK